MKEKLKLALILDDMKYISHINEYEALFIRNDLEFSGIITEYENFFIRKVRKIKFIGIPIQHILYWIKSLKYAIHMRNKYDIVICINPIVALFLGFFNKKRITRIIMCGFLFEEKNNKFYEQIRKIFCLKCFRGIEKIIVYSSKEVNYYSNFFCDDKFIFIKYGIDYVEQEHYVNPRMPENYFFSGGSSNRDYETIFKMYSKYDKKLNCPLCIATNPRLVDNLMNENIYILNDVVLETFWDLLKNSKALILSLKDVQISAGHMVLLQALKYNVPIFVNDIPAVRDYVDESNVTFYETGDIDILYENLVLNDVKDTKNNEFYEQNYTFIKFLERIKEQTLI